MVLGIASIGLLAFAARAHAETPSYDRVLSAVTLNMQGDGGLDRAVLADNRDTGADLYIYLGLDSAMRDDKPAPAPKPALVKKDAAWSGAMWGTRPSLAENGKGSLLIKSENTGIGRGRWSQTVTVIYRDKNFIVAGITREEFDTLDPKAGGSCDLNLLTGKGKRNGKPVETKFGAKKLADWQDGDLPKECVF